MLMSADEELSPEVDAWLANPPKQLKDNSNGYIYFLGILAGETDDPHQVGLQILDLHADREEDQVFFKPAENPDVPQLELPASDLLCIKGKRGCLEQILRYSERVTQLIDSNQVLRSRYRTFLLHKNYETLGVSSAPEIELRYQVITIANRLLHLHAVMQLLGGQQNGFATTLINDIAAIRSLLAKADDFILRMTLMSALAEDFRLISQLYAEGYFEQGLIEPHDQIFSDFTTAERSWELAMKRRFVRHADKVYNFFDTLDLKNEGIDLFAWSVVLLHKPNKTLNEIYPKFHRNFQLSVMSPSQFLISSRNPPDERNIWSRANIIGSILNRKAMVSYQGYIGMMKDIECFIKLVKIRLSLPGEISTGNIDFDQLESAMDITNPYNAERPFIAPQSDKICFSSRPSGSGIAKLCVDL